MPAQPSETHAPYPTPSPQLNLPAIEQRILQFWEGDGTFQASIDQRKVGENEFVFYDGPPFANGLPHYGHLLTGFVKDAVPRYQTMRGRRVERRFGWDCHGLPAEMTAEKELGLTEGRQGIEGLGIGTFNDYCSQLVNRTADEWYRYVTRQARWVNFADDYKTMDLPFMESVIWAFKTLYDKGLVYEGYRVLPYCWECETPLSNFETRQDDSYRSRVDPAITVAFPVTKGTGTNWYDKEFYALAWTTTPWTLPSNLALAVGGDICYVGLRQLESSRVFLIARERVEHYAEHLGATEIVGEVLGRELIGRKFTPIFEFFADSDNAFQILGADFVTTDDGTGIVQLAPGFGEDDQTVCEAAGISVVCPVDDRGRFTAEVSTYQGMQVFEANRPIIADLAKRSILLTREEYEHSYPHCWRTDTPLIYRAVSSWFVKVTAIKEQLLAKNKDINWVPEHVKDGAFGKWLEGARDWSITRNRYWGSPIPVWRSDDPRYPRVDVYGSLDELERDFGQRPDNLHRPYIDDLTRPNPDDPTGKSKMVRTPDILDCWFESGSMPYAQLHYPFENKEEFEGHFPADFIVEFIGQTRGWFYTLHVLSVALFDKPPFEHCMAHGILLGDDGRKLSKRLKNYPDPWEVFETIGADAMRWFLLSSSVLRGQDMLLEKRAIVDTVKRVINPIWNAYYFLTLYGNADSMRGEVSGQSENLLDRYILAKTSELIDVTTSAMDRYELSEAAGKIETFLDALTNWYIRRSRERFWSKSGIDTSTDRDKQGAYDTLHTVLAILTQLCAPLLPMLSEELYKTLTNERSVHLSDWPTSEGLPSDPELVRAMDMVREVCSLGHSIRKAQGARARLPLQSLSISGPSARLLAGYKSLISEELNVKEVFLEDDFASYGRRVLNVIPGKVGPRLGGDTPGVMKAARTGQWEETDGGVVANGIALLEGEYELLLEPKDPRSMRIMSSKLAVVSLDLTPSEELELEGLARDLVREIQSARKNADFQITDSIEVFIDLSSQNASRLPLALQGHRGYVQAQVLAHQLSMVAPESSEGLYHTTITLETSPLDLWIRRSIQ